MKKTVLLTMAAAAALAAYGRSRQVQAERDLWKEATDPGLQV